MSREQLRTLPAYPDKTDNLSRDVVLAQENPMLSWIRQKLSGFYLNMLMVHAEVKIEEANEDILHEFIQTPDKKFLIFAVNHHTSDVDAIAMKHAIETSFPELKDKLVFMVEKTRFSKWKNRFNLNSTIGSYILFDREIMSPAEKSEGQNDTESQDRNERLHTAMAKIKLAMDAGKTLVYFTEGTRKPGALQGNFAVPLTLYLENKEPDSAGVMIADTSLVGLEVLPKLSHWEEMKEKLRLVTKRLTAGTNPDNNEVKVVVHELISSRDAEGNVLTRGAIRRKVVDARKRFHPNPTAVSE